MKNSVKLFVTLFLLAFALNTSMAGIAPTFTMTVKNITTLPNGVRDSIATWEVFLLQTNQGAPGVDDFEYCCGQFTWRYNPAIHTPGGNLVMQLSAAGGANALPAALRPPTFKVDSALGLLLASGNLPSSSADFFISGTFPGTKILTFRIRTNKAQFNVAPLNLQFKLGAAPNTFVAYMLPFGTQDSNANPAQTAVPLMDTVANVYSIENAGFVLPVELASFVANTNRNMVTLNWSTATETNNQSFEIERSVANSNEWAKVGTINGNGTTTEVHNYTFTERVNTGQYAYRLKQIDFNGTANYHALTGDVIVGVPTAYAISQNYPNPFNPSTKIDFELPYDGKVSVLLYDISGREVAKLVNEVKTAGYYTVQFNGSNLASGMYFYRINAEGSGQNFVTTKKMVLIK